MFRVRHNLSKKFKFVEGRTPKRSEARSYAEAKVVRRPTFLSTAKTGASVEKPTKAGQSMT